MPANARRFLRRSSLLLFLAVPFTASGAQQSGALRGVITDSSTRLPVGDVTVAVRGTTRGAISDANGRYSIAGLPPGPQVIVVQRVGYTPRTLDVQLSAASTTELDVMLVVAAQVITPVVVSATRELQRRTEASATIDVLDGAAMREARAAHPAALVSRIPGVHVSQLSGEGHSTAIRQPITTKPLYLYLEDGVPTRSTGFFNHNALYEVNLPQAGGLEVLKGPGTALYGSDAIGGVINALTRPAPASPTVDLALEAGDYGYRRFLATGGFSPGSQGLRMDLNVTKADGFKRDAPYERTSATVRHDLATSKGIAFRTVLSGSSVDQRDVVALNASNFGTRPNLNLSPIAFRDVQALRWSTAVEVDRGATSISLTPFARHNVLGLLPNWQLTFNPEVWDTRNDSYGLLARVRRDLTPMRTRVIAGVDVDYSPGSVLIEGITPRSAGNDNAWTTYTKGAVHYDYDVTYRQASPYLHVEVSPIARARLDVGLRYDNSSYAYDTHLPVLQTGRFRVPADTSLRFSRWSPKVGLTVDVTPQLNVHASWRQGFRAPAQGQLFQQGANLNTTGLDPVTATSRELGVRGVLGHRVLYSVAWYDMRVENDILSILDATGTSTSSNAGATRHHGIESALGALLVPSVRVDLAWSTATQRYVNWVIPVQRHNVSYGGRTIEQAPHTLGNALVTWTPAILRGGRLAVEWSHTGRYYMDPENTHRYDGFQLWTLHGNWHVRGAEIFARVVNLDDRKYAEIATYDAFNRERFTPGSPRMVYAGARWTWQR
ncbi:MAG: TonB-dependent receptor [Gemmatimonadaceae bacterium]|nr:TonB-dependent receptor [Gemmatimonadaceae bacterium]